MNLSPGDYVAAGAAALAAGAVNALAGGGTLISFPTLVAIGVPAVPANVTSTVSLVPGYVSGTWAQRGDLPPRLAGARLLAVAAAAGGLAGSVLLVTLPESDFRAAVPYLILLSCALLLFQNRLRPLVQGRGERTSSLAGPVEAAAIFGASIYGGYFGAGLGIVLLALLGLARAEPLVELNALKQLLSLVVNLVAAAFFALSGHVVWQLVPVMAVGAIVGGTVGGRFVQVVDGELLRRVVVFAGVAVAVVFLVR